MLLVGPDRVLGVMYRTCNVLLDTPQVRASIAKRDVTWPYEAAMPWPPRDPLRLGTGVAQEVRDLSACGGSWETFAGTYHAGRDVGLPGRPLFWGEGGHSAWLVHITRRKLLSDLDSHDTACAAT